jgi:diacylglycerol kinase
MRWTGLGFACAGIGHALREQVHLRIHVLAAVVVIAAGCYYHVSATHWAILSICMGWVISLELLNTATEYLVDLVSPSYHVLAGKVKDVAAAAVLVAACTSVIVAICIFSQYL